MRQGDRQTVAPSVLYTGTKSAIEALTVTEGATAYATDTNEPGWYNGAAWEWGVGDANAALTTAANTFTLGPQTIQPGDPANKGLVIEAESGQTENLLEAKDGASAIQVVVDEDGLLGAGNDDPDSQVDIVSSTSNLGVSPIIGDLSIAREAYWAVIKFKTASNTGNHAPFFFFERSKGTLASPANIASSNQLGGFTWWARAGGSVRADLVKIVAAAGTVSGTNVATYLYFHTTTGAQYPNAKLNLDKYGRLMVKVNASGNSTAKLDVYSESTTLPVLRLHAASSQSDNILEALDSSSVVMLAIGPTGNIIFAEGKDIEAGTSTGTTIGTATSQKLGFWGATPVVQPTALTTQLTTITHTAPGTPDYALQDVVSGGWGLATQDEGNTLLSVVENLQARVAELETKLQAVGLLA